MTLIQRKSVKKSESAQAASPQSSVNDRSAYVESKHNNLYVFLQH